jgi:ribosomal protein L40E
MRSVVDKHIAQCVAELRSAVEREFAEAIAGLTRGVGKPRRASKPVERARRAKPSAPAPKAKDRATGKREAVSAKRECGCSPRGRHRRECKLATGTGPRAAKKPASDDEDRGARQVRDDRPAGRIGPFSDLPFEPARAHTRRPSTAVTPAPELPVIPHLTLVAMLAADRANNAVGDAGGFVARPDAAPSLVGHTDEKREHCPVHGWVGRIAFERDGHEHCEVERSADSSVCARCNGTGWVTAKACKRCDGTGYIEPEAENVPLDEREKVQASVPLDVTVDGLRRRLGRDHRGHDRAETTAAKAFTRAEIAAGWDEIRALDLAEPGFVEPPRPKTRGECVGAEKPCPYVSCRHHLALEVTEAGSIKLVFPDIEPWELTHSCSLDAADLGPHTLDALGEKLNVTRERVRQLEVKSLYAMRAAAMSERVVPRSEIENAPPRAAEGA